jgi:hypothetical protein
MKRGSVGLLWLLGIMLLALRPAYAQQEQKPAQAEQKPAEPAEKPLGPGWLSLDCCVGLLDNAIANGKGAVEKALGISIAGYIDAGYNWASSHPHHPSHISGRYFDMDYNSVVFNDFHILIDKPEKDWGVGFHISGDFGRTGQLLRQATFWGPKLHKEPSAELREAFVTTTIPVGEGIGVKGGLFVTLLGTEIIPAPNAYNDNISRSFMFNLAIPFRHAGVLFSYPIYKKDKDTTIVTATGGVVTGWDDPRDNNHTPSFLGGVTVTPNDTFTFTSNLTAGEEPVTVLPGAKSTARFVISNVWTIKPIVPLGLSLEYTWGHQADASLGQTRGASWQGVAGIASYSWTDRMTTALRAEWFNDRDGARIGGASNGVANVRVAELTLTGAYKFTKMLIGRAEVRHDWSDQPVYRVDTTNFDRNQTTLALQLLYTF